MTMKCIKFFGILSKIKKRFGKVYLEIFLKVGSHTMLKVQ